jgi:hypothetical protein
MNRFFAVCLCAAFVETGLAQTQKNYAFNLPNEVLVLYQVYSEVTLAPNDHAVSKVEAIGSRIRHVLWNSAGLPWLGFDVLVERLDETQIKVSVGPVAGVKFFARKPVDRIVSPADRLMLDILESPETGKKVFDTFQVGLTSTPMQIMPMPRSIPNVLQPGTQIRLSGPRLLSGTDRLASSPARALGLQIQVQAKSVGREFTFTSKPELGYRMEAIAEGKAIRFLDGNATYTLETDSPVIDKPGAWYLWVQARATELKSSGSLSIEGR